MATMAPDVIDEITKALAEDVYTHYSRLETAMSLSLDFRSCIVESINTINNRRADGARVVVLEVTGPLRECRRSKLQQAIVILKTVPREEIFNLAAWIGGKAGMKEYYERLSRLVVSKLIAVDGVARFLYSAAVLATGLSRSIAHEELHRKYYETVAKSLSRILERRGLKAVEPRDYLQPDAAIILLEEARRMLDEAVLGLSEILGEFAEAIAEATASELKRELSS